FPVGAFQFDLRIAGGGLHAAFGVNGARDDHVFTGRGVFPIVVPERPRVFRLASLFSLHQCPVAAVNFQFDAFQRRAVGPGRAGHTQRAVLAAHDPRDDRFHVHGTDAGFAPDGLAVAFFAADGDVFARHVFAHVTAVEQFDAR